MQRGARRVRSIYSLYDVRVVAIPGGTNDSTDLLGPVVNTIHSTLPAHRLLDGPRNSFTGRLVRTVPSLANLLLSPDLSAAQKRNCVRLYFKGKQARGLFATLPRSGWHYLTLLIGVTLDLAEGGDGQYDFYDKAERGAAGRKAFHVRGRELKTAPLDWRLGYGTPTIPKDPEILNTHMPYYRITTLDAPNMRTVILVRNAWAVLESLLDKFEIAVEDYDGFIDGTLNRPYLFKDMLRFLNSWATQLNRNNTMLVRYEDLMKNPSVELRRIMTFLDAPDISDDLTCQAVDLCSKRRNLEKIHAADTSSGDHRVRFEKPAIHLSHDQRKQVETGLRASRYAAFGYDPSFDQ